MALLVDEEMVEDDGARQMIAEYFTAGPANALPTPAGPAPGPRFADELRDRPRLWLEKNGRCWPPSPGPH